MAYVLEHGRHSRKQRVSAAYALTTRAVSQGCLSLRDSGSRTGATRVKLKKTERALKSAFCSAASFAAATTPVVAGNETCRIWDVGDLADPAAAQCAEGDKAQRCQQ